MELNFLVFFFTGLGMFTVDKMDDDAGVERRGNDIIVEWPETTLLHRAGIKFLLDNDGTSDAAAPTPSVVMDSAVAGSKTGQ